ncbi:hypothetical protein TWF718_000163 [Orbilia javanica]|uniref:Uncharacterized protein n=1 Tax=Orbilia javanica TaxID=47235 RepID=A0AAN8N416_9PEZI
MPRVTVNVDISSSKSSKPGVPTSSSSKSTTPSNKTRSELTDEMKKLYKGSEKFSIENIPERRGRGRAPFSQDTMANLRQRLDRIEEINNDLLAKEHSNTSTLSSRERETGALPGPSRENRHQKSSSSSRDPRQQSQSHKPSAIEGSSFSRPPQHYSSSSQTQASKTASAANHAQQSSAGNHSSQVPKNEYSHSSARVGNKAGSDWGSSKINGGAPKTYGGHDNRKAYDNYNSEEYDNNAGEGHGNEEYGSVNEYRSAEGYPTNGSKVPSRPPPTHSSNLRKPSNYSSRFGSVTPSDNGQYGSAQNHPPGSSKVGSKINPPHGQSSSAKIPGRTSSSQTNSGSWASLQIPAPSPSRIQGSKASNLPAPPGSVTGSRKNSKLYGGENAFGVIDSRQRGDPYGNANGSKQSTNSNSYKPVIPADDTGSW